MGTALLYVFGALAVIGGIAMVVQRNPIHSALSLLGTMLSLAAMYALMQAHLIAALQVIIYAGAIVILIVYVIMLLQVGTQDTERSFRTPWIWSLPLVLLFAVLFGRALLPVQGAEAAVLTDGVVTCAPGQDCERDCADGEDTDGDGLTDCRDPDCGSTRQCYGTVEAVGSQLLGPYVLPFEVSSLLLLAGMIGAVLLTGRKPEELAAPPPDVATSEPDPDVAQPGGRVHE